MTQTEAAIQPEVVIPPDTHTAGAPLPAVPEKDAANAAISHVADLAVIAGVPSRDEFMALAMTARILSMSGAAPKQVRGNPYVAFHVALVGRDFNISPSAALNLIDVIGDGDKVQLSLSPQLLNAQIRRLGLGKIVPREHTPEHCIAAAIGPNGEELGTTEFTWAEAIAAELVDPRCKPFEHWIKPNTQGKQWADRCSCRQGYRTYPKRMLWWRAAGYCADDYFPEASLGMYSPEELGAIVDDEGRAIDPTTVDLPDGYQPAAPPEAELASEDDRADLKRRIYALPEAARPMLGAKWQEVIDDAGTPYLVVLNHLPQRQLPKARALVLHFEERAKKGEWGPWEPPTDPEGGPPSPEGGSGEGSADPPPPETKPDVTDLLENLEQSVQAARDAKTAASATTTQPEAVEAPTPPQGAPSAEPGPCPVCRDTGEAADAPCWACTPAEPCVLCLSADYPRHDLGEGLIRCRDQQACWEREQKDPAVAAALAAANTPTEPVQDVESREVTDQDGDPPKPDACPICGSSRSEMVFVPGTHLDDHGMWRCAAASACKQRRDGRSGLEAAKAALAEAEAKAAKDA